jgi:hypothetical protein
MCRALFHYACFHDRFGKHRMVSLGREYSHRREIEQLKGLVHQEQQARAHAEALCTTLQKKLSVNASTGSV